MVLLCAGIWIFRCVKKFQENHRKSTHQKVPCAKSGARGAPSALLARPTPWSRREAAWGGPTHSGALPGPLFLAVAEKPQNRGRFSNLCRGAAATLCSSSGELI